MTARQQLEQVQRLLVATLVEQQVDRGDDAHHLVPGGRRRGPRKKSVAPLVGTQLVRGARRQHRGEIRVLAEIERGGGGFFRAAVAPGEIFVQGLEQCRPRFVLRRASRYSRTWRGRCSVAKTVRTST